MKGNLTRKSVCIFLIYALIAFLAAAVANAAGIVFRQYLRIANEVIITVGFFAVLLIRNIEIPRERKRERVTAKIITVAAVFFVLISIFFQVVMGIDEETVIEKDCEKKIQVERSWIMILERSYYDYKNILWYESNPHYTESYDDGDPNQYIYTDYYNEDGVFTERVFSDEQGG